MVSFSKIYHGWWVLASITLAGAMAYGPGMYGFTLFLKPLAEDFGWSRAITGGAVSIFWLFSPLVIIVGMWTDKYGPRRLLIAGAAILAVCLTLISQIESVAELYALRAAMGIGKILIATPIPVIAARWFSRNRGLATGIALAGGHLGGLLVASPTQYLLSHYGWREASIVLGILIAVLAIPPVYFLLRVNTPGELGLLPDGEPLKSKIETESTESELQAGRAIEEQEGLTLRETIRSPLFWFIAAMTVVYYFGYGSVFAHQASFLTDVGISPSLAAAALALTAGVAVVGVIGFGWATDRWQHKPLLIVVFGLQILSVVILLSLSQSQNLWSLYLSVILFGLTVGAGDVIWVGILFKCFGERDFGKIFGLWYFCMLTTLTISPIVAGYVYDVTQSYQGAFLAVILGSSIVLGFILLSSVFKFRISNW
jgi:MFS family permease